MKNKNIKIGAVSLLLALGTPSWAVDAIEDNREGIGVFNETKVVKKKVKKAKSQKHLFGAYVESGLGYDSNPFLTPSSSYIDYSQANLSMPSGYGVLVEPTIKSGMFVPLFLRASYEYKLKQRIRLLADFTGSGKYFTDSALTNANEYKTELRGGVRFRFNKYKKEINRIDVRVLAGNVYQIYVDHDDGQPKSSIGGDQSNRYQYKKVGAEVIYKYDRKKFDALVRGRYENRNYEDPATWASLDHDYYRLKFQGGYDVTKKFHLGAYYEWRMRDYVERQTYEMAPDGLNIGLNGPSGVNYNYNDVKLFGDYKFTKAYRMRLEYLFSSRTDDNQGYSDYLYHRISWVNTYKFTKKIKSELKLNYYVYDYKNAYAYNQLTTFDKLEAEGYRAYFNTKYRFAKHWSANADLHYREEKSTDKRYAYEEFIGMLTLKYRL